MYKSQYFAEFNMMFLMQNNLIGIDIGNNGFTVEYLIYHPDHINFKLYQQSDRPEKKAQLSNLICLKYDLLLLGTIATISNHSTQEQDSQLLYTCPYAQWALTFLLLSI